MKLFDIIDANADSLAHVGRIAIDAAKEVGVPAYYRDPVLGYVREMPDGTKQQLVRKDGKLEVVGVVQRD